MTLDAGQQVREGRYRVTRVLGEGGQGTTFEAVDAKEGRLVALKRFAVKGASSWKDVELAEREAVVLRNLSHPLVPGFVEHFEEDGALYLVTELIPGESLRTVAKRGERFRTRDIARLLHDLGQIAEYLHRRNPAVIHRDIKPANIIRRDDGRFVLVDFGAVRAKLEPTGGSTIVGTFGYMAPEQFQGRAMPQSDIYAIGVTAISLLTGSEPEDLPHRGLGIDVRACLTGRVDPRLVTLLERMVHPDPDQRLTHISAHVAPLLAASASTPPAHGQAAPSGRSSRAWRDVRKEAKREEKRAERDEKRAERDGRRAERRAEEDARKRERRARREAWSRSWQPRPFGASGGELGPPRELSGPLLALAKLGVSLGAIVLAPLVLSLLSIVFGKELRRAAFKTREAGKRALARLDHEEARLAWAEREGATPPPPPVQTPTQDGPRARVVPPGEQADRVRVDAPTVRVKTAREEEAERAARDAEAEEEAIAEEEARAAEDDAQRRDRSR